MYTKKEFELIETHARNNRLIKHTVHKNNRTLYKHRAYIIFTLSNYNYNVVRHYEN